MLYESFLLYFDAPDVPGPSEYHLKIDFDIYQILSIFIIFVTFSCNRERCFRSTFRLDLELSFCMRSLKSINFAEKIVPAKTNCQNITNFENHTPRITKMSIFMKIKTSPALTPYYSTEPKKLCSTSHFCYILMPWRFQGPQNIINNWFWGLSFFFQFSSFLWPFHAN